MNKEGKGIGEHIQVLMLSFLGKFGNPELALSLAILPGTILGFIFSSLIVGKVQNQVLRTYVLLFVAVSGLLVLLNGIRAWPGG